MIEQLWGGLCMRWSEAQFRLSTDSMLLADFAGSRRKAPSVISAADVGAFRCCSAEIPAPARHRRGASAAGRRAGGGKRRAGRP